MICPFCLTELSKSNKSHIYGCGKNIKSKSEIKYKFISYNHPIISNKEFFINRYYQELNSLPDLKKEFGISYDHSLFLIDYFGIKKRTIQEVASDLTAQDRSLISPLAPPQGLILEKIYYPNTIKLFKE